MRPNATKRISMLLLGGMGFTSLAFAGCQRSVNSIGGPFSPAGGSAPMTGTGPLIPMGPITGATRVPPPSTGSSNLDNSYSNTGAPATGLTMADGIGNSNSPYVNAPTNTYRDSLGGMQIQDLTAQLSPAQRAPYASSFAGPNSNAPVGSGLAPGQQPGPVSLASATSFAGPSPMVQGANAGMSPYANQANPADRMRPIDGGYSVTPPPRYRAIESTISTPQPAPVQPVANRSQADSWHSPAASQSASGTGVANAVYSAPKQPSVNTASTDAALPWRSPTLAR